MNYWDGGVWIDGPKLAGWLDPHLPEHLATGKGKGWTATLARRMYDWRTGHAADAYCVDEYFCRLGLHLSELPDDFWLDRPPGRAQGYCPKGHRIAGSNLYIRPDGWRECARCRRERRRYAQRKKERAAA